MDLASILTFTNILICMLGVAAGIVIGALPGARSGAPNAHTLLL